MDTMLVLTYNGIQASQIIKQGKQLIQKGGTIGKFVVNELLCGPHLTLLEEDGPKDFCTQGSSYFPKFLKNVVCSSHGFCRVRIRISH